MKHIAALAFLALTPFYALYSNLSEKQLLTKYVEFVEEANEAVGFAKAALAAPDPSHRAQAAAIIDKAQNAYDAFHGIYIDNSDKIGKAAEAEMMSNLRIKIAQQRKAIDEKLQDLSSKLTRYKQELAAPK